MQDGRSKELTQATVLRESRPCTREAQPHCTSRRASQRWSWRAIDRPASTARRQRYRRRTMDLAVAAVKN